MEKYPKKLKDEVAGLADFISQNALGNVSILTSAPSNANMKANQIAYYDSVLYIKLPNGETKKFTVTAVS